MTTESVTARLRAAGCVFAEDEAAVLVGAAQTPAELDAMVARRADGEPLEQVVGWAEFCGLRVFVDPGVFVPRRRSEFLVSVAVGLVRVRGASAGTPVIVDLCCGTGALGLAVATGLGREPSGTDTSGRDGQPGERAFAGWTAADLHGGQLHAADLDPAAVACARRNIEPVGGRVYQGDLFDALPSGLRGRTDVLICNAPYVPTGEIAFMPAEAREHEALLALDGGADGLTVLRRAAAEASAWLAPAGVLLVETSERQAPAMAAEMAAAGLHARVRSDDESGTTVVTGAAPAGGAARTLARKASLRGGNPAVVAWHLRGIPGGRFCYMAIRLGAGHPPLPHPPGTRIVRLVASPVRRDGGDGLRGCDFGVVITTPKSHPVKRGPLTRQAWVLAELPGGARGGVRYLDASGV